MSSRLKILHKFEEKFIRKDIPPFKVGDTVKMKVKVQEADKVRLHPWEGVVIAKGGTGIGATFTVRKLTFGEGVEKIFPIHSPTIASLKVTSKGNIRRAKLYYLREKTGKGSRIDTEAVTEAAQAAAAAQAAQAGQVASETSAN
jgi:large subunit ribosomal protein L19